MAGLLLAFYPSAIYFDCLIQKPVSDLFLVSLLLWVLGVLDQKPNLRWWMISGLILGLLALSRENALVLPVVLIPSVLAGWFSKGTEVCVADCWKRCAVRVGSLLAGLALVLVPVALRNEIVGGEFHLTTSQFGPNLFIGNHPGANGMYVALRPGRGSFDYEQQDATELAETAVGHKLRPSEVSSYWTRQVIHYVRTEPMDWLRLMARKFWLTWNAFEAPDVEDQYTYADASPLLRVLTGLFHFGVLCPIAVLGMVLGWPMRRRIGILYLTLLGYAASVAMFYVFARYRFPLVGWLVLFGGAGLVQAYDELRSRRFQRVVLGLGIALVVAVGIHGPTESRAECQAMTQCNLGLNLLQLPDKTDEAISCFQRALELRSDLAEAQCGLGIALTLEGRPNEAIVHLRESLRLNPDYSEAQFNLGNALAAQGQLGPAISAYEESIRLQPSLADAHCNLANALLSRGQPERAISEYEAALKWKPTLFEAHNNLGFALAGQGRYPEAIMHYREALRMNPNSPDAHANLGAALAAHGEREQAVAEYRESLRLDPVEPRCATISLGYWPLPRTTRPSLRIEFGRIGTARRDLLRCG